ncbi:hypothetical protein DJ568_12445 [Mucilaginibacter hurinus]|uniref:Ig-like domain-containing protein n=1 Tax=Mucilaginibacter hurinus TaxID=2201324 RepID=A0A367GMB6_9SPHI|nr:gliding motility-associated C-terminal domain-containing protein [Mucilaginibacter hurinus]RCH54622.1 hypothetical protein DJ568_12445 [Mucilaginibacter hurinus]
MIKFFRTVIKTSLLAVLLLFPLISVCQIAAPTWVNQLGGSGGESVPASVKTDTLNNIYVTGYYSGTVDFDPSAAIYNLTATPGDVDIYVAKYNTYGTLIWAVTFGGDSQDEPSSLTVDQDGSAIISGYYKSANFDADPGTGKVILPSNGGFDAFVIKLNNNGQYVWSKTIGGSGNDFGGRISVDSQGDMISTLRYQSTVNVDGQVFTSKGEYNGLIIKYAPSGNLIWAINLSDEVDCRVGYGDFDNEGNYLVCGTFSGNVNFNPLGGQSLLNANGSAIFLAKYSPEGALIWANPIYGHATDFNYLCINSKNDVFLAGTFAHPLTFNTSVIPTANVSNVYLAKYAAGGDFDDVKVITGNSSSITNYGIVCSADDKIYVSGSFTGTIDFNPSPQQEHVLVYHGQQDFFLSKYDENLNYQLAFGGGSQDCANSVGYSLAIDGNNDVIFTGSFCANVDFSASTCVSKEMTAFGNRDTYLAKYKQYEVANQGIKSFDIPQQLKAPDIDQKQLKITITVPRGTNIRALTPTIINTPGIRVSPASLTTQDFTWPVVYTVSSTCISINYVADVIFSDSVTEKQKTVCNGDTVKLSGDPVGQETASFTWQVLRGTEWVEADGEFYNEDYQSENLTNNTPSNYILNYRRKLATADTTIYDSFYGVTVLPEISDNTITRPVNAIFCGSKDIDEIYGSTPTGGDGLYIYQWQSSSNGTSWTNIANAVSKNYDPPVVYNTIYYRRRINTCGQSLFSNVIRYNIQALPDAPAVQHDTICAGSSATLRVKPSTGITVNWYADETGTNVLYTGDSVNLGAVNKSLIFYAEAVDKSGCASNRVPGRVVMGQPLPAPHAEVGEVKLNSITFKWDTVSHATGYEVSVNGNAFTPVGTNLSHTVSSLSVGQTVNLSVRAIGTLSCQLGNASTTLTATAITSGVNQIYVPNLFSPNGDGNNDVLYVRSAGIKSLTFYVYNQWGEMIFRTASQANGWDGTFKGNTMPAGVYVYYLEATMLDGSKANKKGTVTLIH